MSLFVWVGQTVLAVIFAVLGPMKLLQYDSLAQRRHAEWARDLGPAKVRLIGLLETLGALGLVLPRATGIAPWLSPVSGACLTVLMGAAAWFHTTRGETRLAGVNVLLGVLAAMVTLGLVA